MINCGARVGDWGENDAASCFFFAYLSIRSSFNVVAYLN